MRCDREIVSMADGDCAVLTMEMPVCFNEANPHVWEDAGRIAVTQGPLVYCLESVDQPELDLRDIRLDPNAEYRSVMEEQLGIPVLETEGRIREWPDDVLYGQGGTFRSCRIRLIPYFAFANRGESDMIVWALRDA